MGSRWWWLPLVVVPFVVRSPHALYTLDLVLIYVLLAMSINVLTGLAGQVSFGHAALWAAGAYTSALFTTRLAQPFLAGLVAAPIVSSAVGMMMALPSLRVRGHYLAMVTFAFGEIAHLVMLNWTNLTNGINGIRGIPPASLGPLRFDTERSFYWLALATALLGQAAYLRLRSSRVGMAMLSIRQDEIAASVLGIGISYHKMLAFAVSAVYAGISGSLFAHFLRYVNPDSFRLEVSIAAVMMVVLGGLGHPASPWLGAVVGLGSAELLRVAGGFREIAYGVLLLGVLVYRPEGLAGLAARWSRALRAARAPRRDREAAA